MASNSHVTLIEAPKNYASRDFATWYLLKSLMPGAKVYFKPHQSSNNYYQVLYHQNNTNNTP